MASSKEHFKSVKERLSAYRQQKESQRGTEKTLKETSKTVADHYLTDPILKDNPVERTVVDSTPLPSSTNHQSQAHATSSIQPSSSWLVVWPEGITLAPSIRILYRDRIWHSFLH